MRIITKIKVNWDLNNQIAILEEESSQGLTILEPVALAVGFDSLLLMACEIIKYRVTYAGKKLVSPNKESSTPGVIDINHRKEKT